MHTSALSNMRSTHDGHLSVIVLAAFLTLLTACNDAPNAAIQPAEARFVLKEDGHGRLVRMDTVTGAVTVVSASSARPGTARKKTTEVRVENETSGERVNVVAPAAPERTSEPASACNQADRPHTVTVATDNAPLFIQPRVLPVPLTNLSVGSALPVAETQGDWYLVRFNDVRWGSRVGYIHCRAVRLPSVPVSAEASSPLPSPTTSAPAASRPSNPVGGDVTTHSSDLRTADSKSVQPLTKSETIAGYVEWHSGDHLIADGQRVRWNDRTRLKLGRLPSVARIPLGYEIKVKGVRQADGALLAHQMEVKPNGIAAYESETKQQSDTHEAAWITQGMAYEFDSNGNRIEIGRIVDSGPDVVRARRVLARLLPSYVSPGQLRLRVVQSNIWNASAMQNGSIWVFKGLLDDVSDDELAFVLGHELAHYTHEHMRRGIRNSALVQLVALGAEVAIGQVRDTGRANALAFASDLSLLAWKNGYSREHEDQSDRVGLRYAHEAGYDVTAAVRAWKRVRAREGEFDPVTNFFLGSHSRPTDRIKNIERELRLNYTTASAK